ncbi:MAG TPA: hypothetical protein VFE47_23525, partial [Tepidisphaeraceae bacterium]|nr:hypothetical protein [Tepidisphaeraceae bacterium]
MPLIPTYKPVRLKSPARAAMPYCIVALSLGLCLCLLPQTGASGATINIAERGVIPDTDVDSAKVIQKVFDDSAAGDTV